MTASQLLHIVRAAGGELVPDGDDLRVRAPTPLPTELLDALRGHKAEVLSVLRGDGPLAPYRRRVSEAVDWADLYAVLADAEVAYAAGHLTGEQVEGLAAVCAQEAQTLPECSPEQRS